MTSCTRTNRFSNSHSWTCHRDLHQCVCVVPARSQAKRSTERHVSFSSRHSFAASRIADTSNDFLTSESVTPLVDLTNCASSLSAGHRAQSASDSGPGPAITATRRVVSRRGSAPPASSVFVPALTDRCFQFAPLARLPTLIFSDGGFSLWATVL